MIAALTSAAATQSSLRLAFPRTRSPPRLRHYGSRRRSSYGARSKTPGGVSAKRKGPGVGTGTPRRLTPNLQDFGARSVFLSPVRGLWSCGLVGSGVAVSRRSAAWLETDAARSPTVGEEATADTRHPKTKALLDRRWWSPSRLERNSGKRTINAREPGVPETQRHFCCRKTGHTVTPELIELDHQIRSCTLCAGVLAVQKVSPPQDLSSVIPRPLFRHQCGHP